MTLTREEKITRWIKAKPIGYTLSASELAKDLNMTSAKCAGKELGLQKGVKDTGESGNGNTIIWEKVEA